MFQFISPNAVNPDRKEISETAIPEETVEN
jgi:hypothetical protein